MPTPEQQKLAAVMELLASRICHDIISPVGAINNGIEFMQEMGADAMEEGLELVAYSAEQSAAKLAAFRMAYGAGGRDPHIKPEDVQKAFGQYLRGDGKITQAWDPFGKLGPDPLPPAFPKMLIGGLLLAAEALPKGGMIFIKPQDDGCHIVAEGTGAIVRDGVQDALDQKTETAALDPRLVHPYILGLLARADGYRFAMTQKDEERVIVALTFPPVTKTSDEE